MNFPAFFDTNVLYGALLNDFILELADRGLFRPLWSKDVLEELRRNLLRAAENPDLVDKRITTMERFFVDAMVAGYDDLTPTMTNDAKHSVASFDLEVVHPDDFLLDQLDLYRAQTLRALDDLVEDYNSPAMTIDDYLLALTRAGVPKFVETAREMLY